MKWTREDMVLMVAKELDTWGWFDKSKIYYGEGWGGEGPIECHILNNFNGQHVIMQESLKSKARDLIQLIMDSVEKEK